LLAYLAQTSERQDPAFCAAPLLTYRSLSDEVDTSRFFDLPGKLGGRKIYAPLTQQAGHLQWRSIGPETRWQPGCFGIMEPEAGMLWSPIENPAVLACPLVGFDRCGNRLGLGKGCFDRWLGEVKSHILLSIGLAFSCQECPPIEVEAHDIPLDIIITEGEIITCRSC